MSFRENVTAEYRKQKSRANDLFLFFRSEAQQILLGYFDAILALISQSLALIPEDQLNYSSVKAAGLDKRLQLNIQRTMELAANDVTKLWADRRRMFPVHALMVSAYAARKNQPPWVPVKLDLNAIGKTFDQQNNPVAHRRASIWHNLIHYYLRTLAEKINEDIGSGLLAEESLHAILTRVRKSLAMRPVKRSREQAFNKAYRKPLREDDAEDTGADTWELTKKIFNVPPVEVSEGTYRLEDVQSLQDWQTQVMGWKSRAYDPDDAEQWEKNKLMSKIEQTMVLDAQYLMNETGQTLGPKNMGISDFTWVVSKPQPECDACTVRDGMTLNEIKEKYGTRPFPKGEAYPADLPQNSPPPLHPHCRCQVVPKLKDDWSQETLSKEGYDWQPDDGTSFNPNADQQELGFKKMSWDDWMSKVGGL